LVVSSINPMGLAVALKSHAYSPHRSAWLNRKMNRVVNRLQTKSSAGWEIDSTGLKNKELSEERSTQQLEKVQDKCLQRITGRYKRTPRTTLGRETRAVVQLE
jgi:hypothetical protein